MTQIILPERTPKLIVTPPNLVSLRTEAYDARNVDPPIKQPSEGRVAGKLSIEAQEQA